MKQEPTRGPETPSIDALREELKRSRYRRSYAAAMRHTIVVLVLIVLASLAASWLFFPAMRLHSDAMAPTLQQEDMVLVDRLGKHMRHVQRTDLVAFTGPEGQLLIRRVVALEGESISCRGGRLYIDGNYRLEEKSYTDSLCQDFGPVTVPEGYIFVLCDDRQYGLDSRTLGCIRLSDIMGYVNIRFLREFAIIE